MEGEVEMMETSQCRLSVDGTLFAVAGWSRRGAAFGGMDQDGNPVAKDS